MPKSAWEYYIEKTEIEDSGREREWQELLDVVLVFVRPGQCQQYPVELIVLRPRPQYSLRSFRPFSFRP